MVLWIVSVVRRYVNNLGDHDMHLGGDDSEGECVLLPYCAAAPLKLEPSWDPLYLDLISCGR